MIVRNDVVYRAHGGFVIGSEMSGGARNIFVSDCTFIGTDVGLRFKTTRGRGGIVENIFIKNISMRDIVTDAILFDMYYMGKSPGEDSGTDDKAVPVTEATPQFRNFHVDNVVCIGAEKGLQVRGLPEMNIKNIYLKNLILKTNQGMDIIEGTGISLKNVTLDCKETSPLINIDNSNDISFDNITYPNAQTLFSVSGKKSTQIKISNTDITKAVNKTVFKAGADSNSLTIFK